MPNILDADGLQTATHDELVITLVTGYEVIYGADVNTDSDSPDGQAINLYVQAALDNLDLQAQIYNTFDPDQAIGVTLDQRVALNGIQRLGGTFTLTNITVVTDRSLNLPGLDAEIDNPDGTGYTIQDNAGNQWILAASQVVASSGSHVYSFRAKNPGAVTTTPNTITVPVTITLGVTSVNNPTTYSSLGLNQETDAALKIRRQKSVSISSQGFLAGLLASLLNINGLTDAFIYENNTGTTDGDGIPGHSIWVIVKGGSDQNVAESIYSKRNAGCGMKGTQTVTITQVDGSPFVIRFERVTSEDLYIEFDATSINGFDPVDSTYIKNQLVLLLVPGVHASVNINQLATIVQQIDPNVLVTNAGFSLSGGGPFTDTLTPSSKDKQFALSAGNINITVI